MWDKPNTVMQITDTVKASNISITTTTSSIDDVINISNNFWKTNHPDYQKIYESGQKLSKLDDSTSATVIKSLLQSIIIFYKNQILQSTLPVDQREEEFKKINLLENQAEQVADILQILKTPVDKNALFAYILGYNVNLYQRSKNN